MKLEGDPQTRSEDGEIVGVCEVLINRMRSRKQKERRRRS